jgi:hypothetical protein
MRAFCKRTTRFKSAIQIDMALISRNNWRDKPAKQNDGASPDSRRAMMQAAFR